MNRINLTLIIIIPIYLFFLYSCVKSTIKESKPIGKISGCDIHVYTIGNCEYIGDLNNNYGDWATHKGNCKFCLKRKKN